MKTIASCIFLVTATASMTANATPIANQPAAGFFTGDDGYSHAIVATTDGRLHELFWSGAAEVSLTPGATPPFGNAPLTQFGTTILAVSGHYSSFDGYRHAIVALADGTVHEVYYQPRYGVSADTLFTLSPTSYGTIVQLASYATPDRFQHAVVLTSKGFVLQYRWSPYCYSNCGTNYGFIAYPQTSWNDKLTAYYAGDTGNEHIDYAWTNNGNPFIEDYSFNGSGSPTLATLPGVKNFGTFTAISAFSNGAGYVTNGGVPYGDTIVAGMHDPTGGDFVEEYGYTPGGQGSTTDAEGSLVSAGIVGVSGFADPAANPSVWIKHVVVAAKDGSIWDYWRDNVKNANGNYHFRAVPFGKL